MAARLERLVKLALVVLLGAVSAPASAQVGGIAQAVLNELTALVAPAVLLGVIWLGVLIISRRATLMSVLVFCVGVVIVASGGIF